MKKDRKARTRPAKVRRRAEQRSRETKTRESPHQTEAELQPLLHELDVHRTELEIQNEQLWETQGDLNEILTRYTELYEFAPTGYFTLTRTGIIRQANLAGARLLGVERSKLLNMWFGRFVSDDSRSAVDVLVGNAFAAQTTQSCEVMLPTEGREPRFVHLTANGSEDGETCRLTAVDITERKRAEKALRESEERYRAVVEHQTEAISRFRPDGTFTFVNDAYCRFVGKTREELLGTRWQQLAPPQEVPATEEQLGGLSPSWPVAVVENCVRTGGGELRWMQFVNRAFFDDQGRVTEIQSVGRDITDRKYAADEVARVAREWQRTFDAANDAIFILDRHDQVLRFNKQAQRLFQGLDADFVGKFCCEIVHGTGQPIPGCPLARAKASCRRETLELPIRDRWFEVAVDPILDPSGRYAGAVHIVSDITARKGAEIALRCSEQLYRSVVENIDAGIALVDSNYTLVAVNPAQARMFGKTPDELVGKKCYREFEKGDWVCPDCHGSEAMATGQPTERERQGVRDDGSRFAARVQAFPLSGPDGAATGFVEVVEDITVHKQTEEFLRRAKEAAEAASRAKSEFLANMSHEIRTPMTAILGFADLLMAPNLAYREQRQYLAGIQRNGKALLELISDILDLSRIEADRLTLEKADYPLRQIVDDVLSVARARAEEKGLRLEVDYAFPLPETIYTDRVRLRQVLTNLVGNAVKFTERGEVCISVRCTPQAGGSARVQFSVSDTGIGIPPERIGDLFQPFTQVDGSASRRFGGTGLGLAISRRLAKALGGDVEVASQPGKCSTFTVTIDAGPLDPTRMLQAPQAFSAAEEQPPSGSRQIPLRGRVLLVEDLAEVHVLFRRILERVNLELETAEDGRAACRLAEVSQAEGRPYDLILMDIQMPNMNGYEATQWLRQHGWKGAIVALTAHAMAGDREKCLAAGCDDYLAKPIGATSLQRIFERYLARGLEPPAPASAQEGAPAEHGGLLGSGLLDPGKAAQLTQAYAGELPMRAKSIEDAVREHDHHGLAELAHQLKGTAGVYGFTRVSEAADVVHQLAEEEEDWVRLQTAATELVELCRQAARDGLRA